MTHISSVLETQFPLERKKKFQKKLTANIVSYFFLSLIIAGVIFAITIAVSGSGDVTVGAVRITVISFILLFALCIALYSWYVKAYIKTYYYSADENFLTIKKGVITPSEIHVQYQKIQDVYVDQDLLDRLFGLYDVHIASATAASSIEAHIDGVNKTTADGLKDFLLHSIKHGSSQQAQTEGKAPALVHSVAVAGLEDISSEKYPLETGWFWITLITRSVGTLVAMTFVLLLTGIGEEGTLGSTPLGSIYIAVLVWNIISFLIWRKNYSFKFTHDFIYYKDGVISINERHMPYSSVQDVNLSQGFIDRIFGYADIIMFDATQSGNLRSRGRFFFQSYSKTTSTGVTLQGLRLADAKKITDTVKEIIGSRQSSNDNGL